MVRKFVPAGLTVVDFLGVEGLFRELEGRAVGTREELERWLADCTELGAVLSEEGARRYIAMTCATGDAEVERKYLVWVEEILPECKKQWQKLDEKYLGSAAREELPGELYEVFDRNTANDAGLYREENVGLQTEEAKLGQRYQKMVGGIVVFFEGAERTLPQMGRYLEETDRGRRQGAWEATLTARYQHREEADEVFDKQISLRTEMAKNAGQGNYVEYAFRKYRRFDYSPADCETFHRSVEELCVPVVRKVLERRRARLGLEKLRPWDLSVDVLGRGPLRPFGDAEGLVAGTKKVLAKVSPEFGEALEKMRAEKLLDLESRKGKAPGGYQYTLDEVGKPFIFMNAAGMHNDVQTMLHEMGHALHAYASAGQPLLMYREAPIEFCEVASMGMEMIAGEGLSEMYTAEEHGRAVRQHLESVVGLLPWIAQVDRFQHWVYRNPVHTHEQRNDAWMEIDGRLANGHGMVDRSGYEAALRVGWQRQPHLFGSPLYYIEYGIAQLGALQLWANWRRDARGAVEAYKRALALGGSRPLPELFEAAGLKFDFGAGVIGPLMGMVEDELARLPD